MIRRAIIVGCPGTGESFLHGVSVDMNNYKQYLMSNSGGSWNSSEIYMVKNPNRTELIKVLSKVISENNDYTLISFSGHGWETEGGKTNLLLRNEEEITLAELKTNADRQLIILDSCRAIEREQISESTDFLKAINSRLLFISTLYREKYENLLLDCEKGIIVLYACSRDETAGENVNGGYFSQIIISLGHSYKKSNDNVYLSVQEVTLASRRLINESFEDAFQTPTLNGERRMKYFPWSIFIHENVE
jgi:hypothetical protein